MSVAKSPKQASGTQRGAASKRTKATSRTATQRAAQPTPIRADRVNTLLKHLREQRVLHEEKFSPVYAIAPDMAAAETVNIDPTSAFEEARTTAMADIAARVHAVSHPGFLGTPGEIVKRIGATVVAAASPTTLIALRKRHPGIPVKRVVWAYPQYVHPLREELDNVEVAVAPAAKAKRVKVRVSHQSQPLAQITIRALLDYESGANISAATDSDGIATLRIPPGYKRVEMVYAEPEHSFWSCVQGGFERSAAPKLVSLELKPLNPDTYQLLNHYAAYDPNAGAGVTVGVIDSGIGPHHFLTVAGGACLVFGEDANDIADNGIGHGTHVAGIIAAKPHDGTGIWGIAPACTLMSYRVCPKTGNRGRAQSSDIAAALQKAIEDGCDIINISMGSLESMPDVPELLKRARSVGAVVFAATGNDGEDSLRYPARYPEAVAVGAIGRDSTFPSDCPEAFQDSEHRQGDEFMAVFSNYGVPIDFVGPGVAVLSTYPNNRYAMMSGTSMATPFTAGMAARLLTQNPAIRNMPRNASRSDALLKLLVEQHRRAIDWPAEFVGFGVVVE